MNIPGRYLLAALTVLTFSTASATAQEAVALPPLTTPATGLELPGKFIWFDLATPALDAQQKFYRNVFGWTYESPGQSDDGYVLVLNQGRPVAGMFAAEPPGGEQDGATWITLLSVADVDQAARDASPPTFRGGGGTPCCGTRATRCSASSIRPAAIHPTRRFRSGASSGSTCSRGTSMRWPISTLVWRLSNRNCGG
jgi:predicted enzyme related to lactoylglutathione lyase